MDISVKDFLTELKNVIIEDDIFNGAAALTFYLLLSVFPAVIFLLSVLPYLPVKNLDQLLLNSINQILPSDAAKMFSGIISEVTSIADKKLVSFGVLATIWAASSGMFEIMKQMNKSFGIKEARPFWLGRSISILMTLVFGLLVIGAFLMILFGEFINNYATRYISDNLLISTFFDLLRWSIVVLFMLLGFAVIYYFGPNKKQKFKIISVGGLVSVCLMIAASLGFRFYVENFSNYSATYGSIGAVIVLMLWLYITGAVIIFGSEINALLQRHLPRANDLIVKI